MDTLGNGENRAYIYDRTGTTRLLELVHSRVEWPREQCAISRATVVVPSSRCTPEHGLIAYWAHTLVIYRSGERVWEGPVTKIIDGPGGLTLTAGDVLAWTERRELQVDREVSTPVVSEMDWLVRHAFADDDPGVLAYLTLPAGNVDLGAPTDRDVTAFSAYIAAELGNLVGAGGRYTALGRSILLWPASYVLGRTRTLVPERHLLTDVNVIQDGYQLGERVVARDDQGNVAGADGNTGFPDPYYGRVTLLVSTGATTSVGSYATQVRAQSYPAPLTIDVPTGAALACDSPFPMHQLVPGTLVPVETTTATGKTVSATMVLNSVKVTQDAGEDETVGITLAPLSTAAA